MRLSHSRRGRHTSGLRGGDPSPLAEGVGGAGLGVTGDPDHSCRQRTARCRRRAHSAAPCRGRIRLCRAAFCKRLGHLRCRGGARGDWRLQPGAGGRWCRCGPLSAGAGARQSPATRRGASPGAHRAVGSMDPAAGPQPHAVAERAGSDCLAGCGRCAMAARAVAPRGSRFLCRVAVGADRAGRCHRHVVARGRVKSDDDTCCSDCVRPCHGCDLTAHHHRPDSPGSGWCRRSDHGLGRHRARPCGPGPDRGCAPRLWQGLGTASAVSLRLASDLVSCCCRCIRSGSRGQRGDRHVVRSWQAADPAGAERARCCCGPGSRPVGQPAAHDNQGRRHHRLPPDRGRTRPARA